MAGLHMVRVWCLALLAIVVPLDAAKECPIITVPLDKFMTLGHQITTEGQLEAYFHFHPPAGNTSWTLLIALMPERIQEEVVGVGLVHTPGLAGGEGEDRLVAWCKNDSAGNMTIVPSPWSIPSSHLNTSHNITLQVGSEHVQMNDTTSGHSTAVLRHNCSGPLKHFPNLALALVCGDSNECGAIEYCWEDCDRVKVPPNYRPLILEHHNTTDGQLEAQFHHHPPLGNTSWVLTLSFTSLQKVDTRVAHVLISHTPPQYWGGEELVVICEGTTEQEVTRGGRTRGWWDNITSQVSPRGIKLQVGSAHVQVNDTTSGKNTEVLYHKCAAPLQFFPNLTLRVACLPGTPDCGSVRNCSSGDCRSVKVPQLHRPLTLDHQTTKDGQLEALLHLQLPPDNTSWVMVLLFTPTLNSSFSLTSIVANVMMVHTPGVSESKDILVIGCDATKEKDNNKAAKWSTNSSQLTPRNIKIQVGSAHVQVNDTTVGQNTEVRHHKCNAPLQHFPNLTLRVFCYPGETGCGSVSTCSIKESAVFKQPPLPQEMLAKLVIRMIIVEVWAGVVLGTSLAWLWYHYLGINILPYLLPLVRCPPPFCHTPHTDNKDESGNVGSHSSQSHHPHPHPSHITTPPHMLPHHTPGRAPIPHPAVVPMMTLLWVQDHHTSYTFNSDETNERCDSPYPPTSDRDEICDSIDSPYPLTSKSDETSESSDSYYSSIIESEEDSE